MNFNLLRFSIFLSVFLFCTSITSQGTPASKHNTSPCPEAPSGHQLADISDRAEQKVISFFETIIELGTNEKLPEMKALYVDNTSKLFTGNGTVEERSKYSKQGIVRPVREYLQAIKARSTNTRIIINYEVTDPLLPHELVCKEVGNQLILQGSMTVRQYYCKLKKYAKPSDNFNDTTQCDYWDITDKKINIEMKLMKTVNGYGWVSLITSIVVLNVQ